MKGRGVNMTSTPGRVYHSPLLADIHRIPGMCRLFDLNHGGVKSGAPAHPIDLYRFQATDLAKLLEKRRVARTDCRPFFESVSG